MIDKWDARFLRLAKEISTWSKDPSTQIGAIIVAPGNRVVSMGYNGFARGVEDSLERLNDRELKYKMIVHAERNALLFARENMGYYTLYTHPFMPCAPCAAMIIQTGIKKVISWENDNPRWQEDFEISKIMFQEAEVELKLYPVEKGMQTCVR